MNSSSHFHFRILHEIHQRRSTWVLATDRKIELGIINDANFRPKITISTCSRVLCSRVSLSFLSQKPAMAPCQDGWKGVTRAIGQALPSVTLLYRDPIRPQLQIQMARAECCFKSRGWPLRRQRRSVAFVCVDLSKLTCRLSTDTCSFFENIWSYLLFSCCFVVFFWICLHRSRGTGHSCMNVAFLPGEKVRSMKRRATSINHFVLREGLGTCHASRHWVSKGGGKTFCKKLSQHPALLAAVLEGIGKMRFSASSSCSFRLMLQIWRDVLNKNASDSHFMYFAYLNFGIIYISCLVHAISKGFRIDLSTRQCVRKRIPQNRSETPRTSRTREMRIAVASHLALVAATAHFLERRWHDSQNLSNNIPMFWACFIWLVNCALLVCMIWSFCCYVPRIPRWNVSGCAALNPFGLKSWQHLLKPEKKCRKSNDSTIAGGCCWGFLTPTSTTWLGEIRRATSCLCCGHTPRLGISDVFWR